MAVRQLIYASTYNDDSSPNIENILEKSRKNNTANKISGVLYFSDNFFMQYLEGDATNIEVTFDKILKDKRHSEIKVMLEREIPERLFGKWSMAYIPKTGLITFTNLKYLARTEFNPYNVSSSQALKMMLEIKELL